MQKHKYKGPSKGPRTKGNQKKKPQKEMSKRAAFDLEIKELQDRYNDINPDNIKKFVEFPLSKKTQKALTEAKFITPTEVQRQSIGPALQGKDVLGAAITGSGKTLAFLIPVLEHLFVNKWSRSDGVGAIIISPTRELAYQIFETLKKVGKHHDFSAGLIIGGKNLKFERTRMDQCNIVICTPGRLLQHMDENPLFNTTTMEMLVLDEADRCLDLGFQKTLNSIIENFPPERQTLLFSATQTNTVEDLARLSLRDPVYVGYGSGERLKNAATSGAQLAVPELLQQSYVVIPLHEKITVLWSFIKNHLKQKIIVFVASCKQAKYLYEIFCKLRPGVSLLALYGTLHQDRRIAIYEDFLRKSQVVMFATDVASRGLDFPAINWVVQLDCPEDVSQYIHRAGRSARNKTRGECLLVLTPSEEDFMINAIKEQLKVDIRCVQIDSKKLFSPRVKIEAFLAQFPELRASAQRAFLAYLKSVFLMRNKRLFNVLSLDLDAYAQSLGLAVTPRVNFLEKVMWRLKQNKPMVEGSVEADATATKTETPAIAKKPLIKKFGWEGDEDEEDEDFIKVKRRDHNVDEAPSDDCKLDDFVDKDTKTDDDEDNDVPLVVPKREKVVTKAALAKKAMKKNIQVNSKVKFDEDGQTLEDERNQMKALAATKKLVVQSKDDDGGIDIGFSGKLLAEEDKYDKERFRELVKKRHKQQREKLKRKAEREQAVQDDSQDDEQDGDEQSGDDESEGSVDLSWLPDPDKIYNKGANASADVRSSNKSGHQSSDSHENDEDENGDTDDDYDEPALKKSKLTQKLTLMDAEAIAASLLGT
ncbi:probable ATP-dependent RNA helicase DDX10 [Scaptodrosophila lebanonensis]|uniref:ATP-dependent RNA helicase n=1 Tax=Drosophila lebanonensis TaxID=7225 RepID=A0A6J2TSK1_DROLE|nr:probable ATP-dependent RNA helicase DDX10 [Scaptodrosophila lebanonensis]